MSELFRGVMGQNFQQVIDLAGGFWAVRFGWAMADVENVLGRPDEAEIIDPEISGFWRYKPLKLSVAFFESPVASPGSDSPPLRVVSFMTGHESATLWGTRIVGLGKLRLLSLFADHGYQGFTSAADELAAWGYETLRLEQSHITLDLHRGVLKRMQWG